MNNQSVINTNNIKSTISEYDRINNENFNSSGLPEKLRKYYRYDFTCPIQSAWIEYYRCIELQKKRNKNLNKK
jgi:hypothetical protein